MNSKALLLIPFILVVVNISAGPREFRQDIPVRPAPDGNLYLEAEEFKPGNTRGWKSGRWGENYYAATFANTFLSRKAFLGAPEQSSRATASIRMQVAEAGRYLALARYESAYRFETQFRVQVEQDGRVIYDRLYGARRNLKIWPFGQKLKDEHAWSWGASENIVWEGHDTMVELKAGIATVRLIADRQPLPAARRNVDLLLFTRDREEMLMRIEKEKYLPLDGLLTQQGDLQVQVSNPGKETLVLTTKNGTEHSPYWVHLRKWKPLRLEVPAGETSQWTEIGHLLDTMNDGQWDLQLSPPTEAVIHFAVVQADGTRRTIHTFEGQLDKLQLAYDGDTRYSQKIRLRREILFELLDFLEKQPVQGRTPTRTLLYGYTFKDEFDDAYAAAITRFKKLYGLTSTDATSGTGDRMDGYIDVRRVRTDKLAEYCMKLGPRASKIATVSLGDEISLPKPSGKGVTAPFQEWLRSMGLKPGQVSRDAGNWDEINYGADSELREANPSLYYWSQRYRNHYGIHKIKERTNILRKHLPNAGIGANFSPHYPAQHRYLGEVHKWVTIFREEGMTQPWSEDYIFQMPVCTPQVNNINLDLLRAGTRGRPKQKIHYYCMAHWPSNRPDTWRRLFYGALGHGMQIVNLFEFRPVQVAYTENHVTHNETYAGVLKAYRELGNFEGIVQEGRPRQAKTALWFSETGDIWGDNHGSFAAAKRTLYTVIRHQEIPLDFLIEPDALNGTLDKYNVLYLSDKHVSSTASRLIAKWVASGGTLFSTAGAGMFNEYNEPNETLRKLLGVDLESMQEPENSQVSMVKQDLPFAKPISTVNWQGGRMETFGAQAILKVRKSALDAKPEILASFAGGGPAILRRKSGRGTTYTCAFLPGLSYYRGATPKIPVDRSSSVNSLIHFLPTKFNDTSGILIGLPGKSIPRPVRCSAPLVESCVLDSPKGSAIILVNWTRQPRKALHVFLGDGFPNGPVRLASGGSVSRSGNRVTLDLETADALLFGTN